MPSCGIFRPIAEGTRFALLFTTMAKTRSRQDDEVPLETQAAPQAAGDTTAAVPDRDRVASRAYELYQARGGADGQALEDWLAAERELEMSQDDRRGG